LTVLVSALMCSCGTTPAANEGPAPTPAFNGVPSPAGDCWARLYEHRNLGGRVLTIAGPARIGGLAPHLGYPWDPRYESLVVGPGAMLELYDDAAFKERAATFRSGAMVPDLNHEMGMFRRTRSVMVVCVDTKQAQRR
jgi:hypothetical protein